MTKQQAAEFIERLHDQLREGFSVLHPRTGEPVTLRDDDAFRIAKVAARCLPELEEAEG